MDTIPANCIMQLCGRLLDKIDKRRAALAAEKSETLARIAQEGEAQETVLDPRVGWGDEQLYCVHSDVREQSA